MTLPSTTPSEADLEALLDEAMLMGSLVETKAPRWSAEEDAFLRAHLGYLSEEEIGAALGRSATAVHLRWERDLDLPAPSKTPGYHTMQGVARILGTDIHAVSGWVHRGWLPARALPGERNIHVVTERALIRFAVNPLNWIYFKPERVQEPHLRQLLARRRERWGDEWWTPGQVAAYHGVEDSNVNDYIHAGKLHGVKWGNWRILRSEATRADLIFYKGKGSARVASAQANERTDRFIVLALAVGLTYAAIDRALGHRRRFASHRVDFLMRDDRLGEVAVACGASYDEETGCLWADWRRHRQRFPGLARRLERWAADEDLDMDSRQVVRTVLRRWAEWFAETPEDEVLAARLAHGAMAHPRALERAYLQLREQMELDPLAPLSSPAISMSSLVLKGVV